MRRTCGIVGLALPAEPRARPIASAFPLTTDDALIAAATSGQSEAFGVLVERYERAVYHLCLRTLRDGEEAKDATQEAFFKAFRAMRTFRRGAKFSTWVFTIAYRACCDRLARRKRYGGGELPERADPAAGPQEQAESADEARRLRAAIDALPEKYRTVITLFHLQNKQYEEIAQVLDLPLGTVKTHLFRAKESLRKALENGAPAFRGETQMSARLRAEKREP
jgi:RNA polymerase sigma-70 factor (ECF subfamily)